MNTFQPIQLNEDQINSFKDEGYLIVPDVLSDEEVDSFLEHQSSPRPKEMQKGLLTHTVDPQWRYVAKHPNIAGISEQLLSGQVRIVQTMYLEKPPSKGDGTLVGRGIALHQDTHYLPSEPNTLMACWIAMNDTDEDNGGLCVVPKSNQGELRKTHRNFDDEHTSWEKEHLMRDRIGKEWKQTMVSFQIEDLDDNEIVRLTVPRGAGVFFTGMTIHGSFSNYSKERERLAFAVHYVKEGTWLLREDVQETEAVSEYSEVG